MAATRAVALPALPPQPVLSRGLQHLLAILVVAAAIKEPLGVPLYWNAGLLGLGLFGLICLQSLQRPFLWMVALIALGMLGALIHGTTAWSGPRLAQLFLLVLAGSVVARIDPDLLIRYLILLLPVMALIWLVETMLPEPLFKARVVLGEAINRQGGLYGEPNYSAMLYGVIAVLLARRPPRALAILPFLLAVPMLSRGVWLAAAAWLGIQALGRFRTRAAIILIGLLCLQPFLVLGLDLLVSDTVRLQLVRLTTDRLAIWQAYLQMGLSDPLGVGYFRGTFWVQSFGEVPRAWYAHSIFMQVFGEFGWLGYLVFLGFLSHLGVQVARSAPAELPVLVFLLTGYAFVNGLSDWAFWITIGYCLARTRGPATARPPGES